MQADPHETKHQRWSLEVDEIWRQWPERLQRPLHRELAKALIVAYRERGLLPNGRDESLMLCCPSRQACWYNTPAPADRDNSGITLPWIGRSYFQNRVVILATNFDSFGGLAGNYWVCEDHIRSMREGTRGKDNRPFARNAMLYLGAVQASLTGQELSSHGATLTNESLADLWECCALLQTVKCSPGTERSYPTEAMFCACPEFIAMRELEILAPSVVLLFGRTSLRDVVRPWAVPKDGYGDEQGPHLERDEALIAGRRVPLISLNHPASQNAHHVAASLDQLRESLSSQRIV